MVTMTLAARALRGRCANLRLASFRNSARISCGINRTVNQIAVGSIIMSSRYPITGMKSGIKSMGLSA